MQGAEHGFVGEPSPRIINELYLPEYHIPQLIEGAYYEVAGMYRTNGWELLGSIGCAPNVTVAEGVRMLEHDRGPREALMAGALLGPVVSRHCGEVLPGLGVWQQIS